MAERNFQNRTLFKGDNLDFLQGMNSGTVDLIATDPPFNKDKDFYATPDSLAAGARFQDRWRWDDDVQPEWVDNIKDDEPRVYSLINHVVGGVDNDPKTRKRLGGREDLAAFLCFMGVRLIEMRRVLKDTGSIYLHCDPTASHYLKSLMDAIFGDKNFRNEIIWKRVVTAKSSLTRDLARNHDIILRYSKTRAFTWNVDATLLPYDMDNLDEKTDKQYARRDSQGRRMRLTEIVAPGDREGQSGQPIVFGGQTINPPKGKHWVVPGGRLPGESVQDGLSRWERQGRLVRVRKGSLPRFVRYLDEQRGRAVDSIWIDIPNLTGSNAERIGYPTQKPLALYERIISASSNLGDLVLDPFCGCATTPIAAERLGRQWVGMDLWDGAYAIVKQRMEENKQLLADDNPQIIYTEDAPERDDGGEDAPAFELPLRKPRIVESWQKLSHAEMRDILYDAQEGVCGGCGRELEKEFMELDHIMPRADGGANDITNRIMLCSPCNRKKSHTLTLSGLVRENRKSGWMRDANRAKRAVDLARLTADKIKNADA